MGLETEVLNIREIPWPVNNSNNSISNKWYALVTKASEDTGHGGESSFYVTELYIGVKASDFVLDAQLRVFVDSEKPNLHAIEDPVKIETCNKKVKITSSTDNKIKFIGNNLHKTLMESSETYKKIFHLYINNSKK